MRSALELLVTSKARAEILKTLFVDTPVRYHLRELARISGLNVHAVTKEIQNLKRLDLLQEVRDGNRVYYSANRQHPIFHDLKNIVLKIVGPIAVFQETLLKSENISVAFLFGSLARNEAKANSDIDLIIIGEISMRKLFSLLGDSSERLGREINPHIYTIKEFAHRVQTKDHFLTQVLETPKSFIKGDEHELARLAKSRLAEDS
jgi:predicted nucleotidyltransferase